MFLFHPVRSGRDVLSLITLLVTKVTSHLCTSEGSLQTGLRVGHTQPVPPRQLPGKGERWGSQEALPLGAGGSSVGPREQVPRSLSCLLPRPSFVYIQARGRLARSWDRERLGIRGIRR